MTGTHDPPPVTQHTAHRDEKQMMMVVLPHGLAWTGGAGALRTRWKLIGVGVYASGDVRGEPCSKIQVDWSS